MPFSPVTGDHRFLCTTSLKPKVPLSALGQWHISASLEGPVITAPGGTMIQSSTLPPPAPSFFLCHKSLLDLNVSLGRAGEMALWEKVLACQAWEPEFGSQHPHKELGTAISRQAFPADSLVWGLLSLSRANKAQNDKVGPLAYLFGLHVCTHTHIYMHHAHISTHTYMLHAHMYARTYRKTYLLKPHNTCETHTLVS